VLPALTLVFATTITVAPPAGGGVEGCPSGRQVTEALNARVPGLVSSTANGPGALRLSVSGAPETEVSVDLVDGQGESVLRRVLPAPAPGRTADCPALAETVALIVERYLHDVGYEAPPLAPPAPKPPSALPPTSAPAPQIETRPVQTPAPAVPVARDTHAVFRLGTSINARRGDIGGFDGDATLALAVEGRSARREGWHLGASLSAGLAPRADARWGSQTATLHRVPMRLGIYLRLPAGPGHLEPGVGLGADALLVSTGAPNSGSERHLAPFADLALGYALPLVGPLYLRALSRAALAEPYSFKTRSGAEVWGTPRAYLELGVELGVAFP
jgi:hypothetical protein